MDELRATHNGDASESDCSIENEGLSKQIGSGEIEFAIIQHRRRRFCCDLSTSSRPRIKCWKLLDISESSCAASMKQYFVPLNNWMILIVRTYYLFMPRITMTCWSNYSIFALITSNVIQWDTNENFDLFCKFKKLKKTFVKSEKNIIWKMIKQ